MTPNPTPMPGTRQHIMEWDDYDAACEMLDRSYARRRAERNAARAAIASAKP